MEQSRKWLDEEANLNNGQVMELRNVLEQHGEAIEELRADNTALRERIRALETCNDDFDISLTQHDDRLDQVEAAILATPLPPATGPAMVSVVPVKFGRGAGTAEAPNLSELAEALEQLTQGVVTYQRHGVTGEQLLAVIGMVELAATERLARERVADAEDDLISEAWLAGAQVSA